MWLNLICWSENQKRLFKTMVKYESTIFYPLLQNKSLGVRRHAYLFWKVLCTHLLRKCLVLYRGYIFKLFVELQWHSFETIYSIKKLHAEAFLAVFPLFLYKRHVIWKKISRFSWHWRQKTANKFPSIDFQAVILLKLLRPALKGNL